MKQDYSVGILEEEAECPISGTMTKSFRQYTDEMKQLYKLQESPHLATNPDLQFELENMMYNLEQSKYIVQKFPNNIVGKFNLITKEFLIYEIKYGNDEIDYYIIENNHIVGYCKLFLVNNIWSTHGLWHIMVFQKLITIFFKDFLLPKYKIILSDNTTTQKGKDFWKNMIQYPTM